MIFFTNDRNLANYLADRELLNSVFGILLLPVWIVFSVVLWLADKIIRGALWLLEKALVWLTVKGLDVVLKLIEWAGKFIAWSAKKVYSSICTAWKKHNINEKEEELAYLNRKRLENKLTYTLDN